MSLIQITRKNANEKQRPIVFYALLFICLPLHSFAQYRYDLGLKVSSYELDRFQLDARYHLDNPYTLILSMSSGSQTTSNRSHTPPVYPDSVFNYSDLFVNKASHMARFGLQRDLDFLDADYFYGGLSIGFGYVRKRGSSSFASYTVDSIVNNQIYSQELNSSETIFLTKSLRTELALSFGVDVPLAKRFIINGELGLSTNLQTSFDGSESPFLYQQVYLSGGIRYSLGKRVDPRSD